MAASITAHAHVARLSSIQLCGSGTLVCQSSDRQRPGLCPRVNTVQGLLAAVQRRGGTVCGRSPAGLAMLSCCPARHHVAGGVGARRVAATAGTTQRAHTRFYTLSSSTSTSSSPATATTTANM
ncbi:hypothetical protein PoB_006262800 [Plakobranchus ocellatus]|uniref:Uncharacterized protein n=1 Tax=Plakobranchus ocellatus TaxID=259542 RepID=A0AAV4CW58_9GAST|nr:hypothetical protein PoB_006262800 [Plakobranchus ocellatus]